MILLNVISFNGQPATGPSAKFDELGGTIGRSDNNQLTLPDPERNVSRQHARILFRQGAYVIVDEGSNPIKVNDKPLSGGESVIKDGDRVSIGAYVLSVSLENPQTKADPFADLFGEGLAGSPKVEPSQPLNRSAGNAAIDPSQSVRVEVEGLGSKGIPDDWDFFAPDSSAEIDQDPALSSFGQASPLVQAGRSENSLDDLFGLDPGKSNTDPLAAIPPGGATEKFDSDPLDWLDEATKVTAPSIGDLASDLSMPMPIARFDNADQNARISGTSRPPGERVTTPEDAVFSWDEVTNKEVFSSNTISPAADASSISGVHTSQRPDALQPSKRPSGDSDRDDRSKAFGTDESYSGDSDALLQALLDGLGVGGLKIDRLTPDTMYLLGQLLHEATRGAIDLLAARTALKREIRADVTMIGARENNPIKFSPSVEVALQHLLSRQMPGFMAAAPAMRDAFEDLRAHQLGVMAGMRAALEGVLKRFDPVQLEGKLVGRSTLGKLIPGARKARLWEVFETLFTQLQAEAQDDFEELFGRAFLQAYEEQLIRLQDESASRS